ncbi:MAG: hypothetical protein JWP59_893 [Massilia sp.]|nr:hypothetical protein [Massilia sp.]
MTDSSDDDRTVLGNSAPFAPAPSSAAAERGSNALAIGTRIGEFEILSLLGVGGFGIVYLAYDHSLERKVALKEYMPSAFAARSTQLHVSVLGHAHRETFEAGLRSFVNEARILAQFDHPALLKVYRFWEGNGTAYMVMPFYQGPTLKQMLAARPAPPDETLLKAIVAPLLDTLTLIHSQNCFHRDISPDNILMLGESHPLLLDFGAARRAIAGIDQAFTVIVKQNYAPIEQYAELPGMTQGPWTDLFALAAVLHFAIDGKAPPPAVSRSMRDPYVPLAQRYSGRFGDSFLQAIDRALAVAPADRPQSAAALRELMGLGAGAPAAPLPPIAPKVPAARTASARPGWLLPAGVAALALLAGGAYWVTGRTADQPVQAAKIAPATVVAAPAPAAAVADKPFDPITALRGVLDGASPDRLVAVNAKQPRVLIGRDKLGFSVRASHAGYVYVLMVGTNRSDFNLLFPNEADKNNRIAAGQTIELPRKNWLLDVGGPAGVDQFAVIVSDSPRDFSGAGLQRGELFGAFPIERAAVLSRDWRGATPLFAGAAECGATAGCSGTYGASMFSIEEAMP